MSWIDELHFDDAACCPWWRRTPRRGAVLMLAYANREAVDADARHRPRALLEPLRGAALAEGRDAAGTCRRWWRYGWTATATPSSTASARRARLPHGRAKLLLPARWTEEALGTPRPRAPSSRAWKRSSASASAERPEGSYTTYLFEKGLDKILKKVGEEATEVVIAAKNAASDELRAEAADLLFHLLVLLRARGLPLEAVWSELETRFGGPAAPAPRPSRRPPALLSLRYALPCAPGPRRHRPRPRAAARRLREALAVGDVDNVVAVAPTPSGTRWRATCATRWSRAPSRCATSASSTSPT